MKICALYKALYKVVENEQFCTTYDKQNIIQTNLWSKLFNHQKQYHCKEVINLTHKKITLNVIIKKFIKKRYY